MDYYHHARRATRITRDHHESADDRLRRSRDYRGARDRLRVPRRPQLGFGFPLERPTTRPAGIARHVDVDFAVRRWTAEGLPARLARGAARAGVHDRFAVAVRLRPQLIEELLDRDLAQVVDEARNQAFEQDEPLTDWQRHRAMDQVANRRMV